MSKTGIFLLFVWVLLREGVLQAQEVQWAQFLDFQYNNYGDNAWSGNKALGPPDALPAGGLHENSFRMKLKSCYGTIVVGFKDPQEVRQIAIVENYDPGRIVEVVLIDELGTRYSVYTGKDEVLNEPFRTFYLNIPQTSYKVAKMEINLSTLTSPGWPQIDAIGISNCISEQVLEANLLSAGAANLRQNITFSSEKENLGTRVNSVYPEAKPIISPDGKKLYFVRQNAPENSNGKKDIQDIYCSDLTNGQWTTAQNLGKPLNDRFPNGVCSVSPDGNSLLLINGYLGGEIVDGVSISNLQPGGWSAPKMLKIADFYNRGQYQDYFLSNSGKVLLLALERNDTRGSQDIYASFKKDNGEWSAPQNLGSVVNSSGAEFSPFLASDDRTLYFASNGHAGFGESDIFFTKRLDETWNSWSKPQNLGEKVNTQGWDAYYSVSAAGDVAYFISAADAQGNSQDIFSISLPTEFKPDPVVLVQGKVFNSKTNEPIRAEIRFESLPGGKEEGIASAKPTDGSYKVILPQGKKYGLMAAAKGFIAVNENLDFTSIEDYQEIIRDLYLVPLEVGQVVKLNNLFFEQSKANLLDDSYPELNRLLNLLQENQTLRIELAGHTDNQGLAHLNMELSLERVQTIKNYLVERGIDKKRIETIGHGGSKPVTSNANPETRAQNRRVEIKILDL